MKKLVIGLLFLVLISSAYAGMVEDIEVLRQDIEEFIDDPNAIVIVEGEHASLAERVVVDYIRELYPEAQGVEVLSEEDINPDDLEGKTVFLLGGPMQNQLSSDILKGASVDERRMSIGIVALVEKNGRKVVVFSDYTGFDNLPNTAAAKSPLAQFMPVAYVPAAASIIGLSLLWLWEFISKLFVGVFRRILSSRIVERVRKRGIKDTFLGFHIMGIRFKVREAGSIFIAAVVFAVSLSYMYLSPSVDVITFFIITSAVNFSIYGVRHLVRVMMDKKYGLHTEYVIWYWGALLTAFTAWLGNTFSLAGYVVKGHDKDTGHEGKVALVTNILSFLVFVVFWVLNFLRPSIVLQMFALLALAITFMQMLPFKPFSGKNVYRWNKWVWGLFFIPLLVVYILVNLVI